MNKFRKITAAVLAAALMAGTAVTANAEQSQAKLLTANPFNLNDSGYGGGGYFNTNDGFFKIGEEELEKWRETGKLEPVKIECDIDVSGLSNWSGSFVDEGSYAQFVKRDSDGNVTERYILHLDKANGKIETAYTLGADWCVTRPDGYTFGLTESGSNLQVIVYDPFGKKTEKTLTYTGDGEMWYNGGASASVDGNNVGYLVWQTAHYTNEEYKDGFGYDSYDYEVLAVNKNGNIETIYKNSDVVYGYGYYGVSPNSLMFGEIYAPTPQMCKLYSEDSKKVYDIGIDIYFPDGSSGYNLTSYDKLYGTKTVIGFDKYINEKAEKRYALADVSKNTKEDETDLFYGVNALSKAYKSMSTQDGKIYLVKTEDDKWGYIDDNGKELAIFDDAGDFKGDFAPVVKDGKAYLIDRNMNKVSEEIAAKGVRSLGEDMFVVTTDDGQELLMTYDSKPTTSTSEPTSEPTSKPTSTPTSKPTSTPTSEPSDNPNTGIPGIAATFGVLALAAGAVIVAKKKKDD